MIDVQQQEARTSSRTTAPPGVQLESPSYQVQCNTNTGKETFQSPIQCNTEARKYTSDCFEKAVVKPAVHHVECRANSLVVNDAWKPTFCDDSNTVLFYTCERGHKHFPLCDHHSRVSIGYRPQIAQYVCSEHFGKPAGYSSKLLVWVYKILRYLVSVICHQWHAFFRGDWEFGLKFREGPGNLQSKDTIGYFFQAGSFFACIVAQLRSKTGLTPLDPALNQCLLPLKRLNIWAEIGRGMTSHSPPRHYWYWYQNQMGRFGTSTNVPSRGGVHCSLFRT